MGMCYNKNYFCAGIVPLRSRLTSYLLLLDLNTGRKVILRLFFTKGIHSLVSLDDFRLLAASTQTEMLSEITFNENLELVYEDLFFAFHTDDIYKRILKKSTSKQKRPSYREDTKIDNFSHTNGLFFDGKNIYCTQFVSTNEKYSGKDSGVMLKLPLDSEENPILSNLYHPHTPYIDSKGNYLVCESGRFKLINITTGNSFLCNGYTRGICEEKGKGYWVGISRYRKYSKTNHRWLIKTRKDIPEIQGAVIQFVDYDFKETFTIDLSQYGQEIFDLIPWKDGVWNEHGRRNSRT
jgi:hypothetical protein